MPVTVVAVVYSKAQARRRWTVVPENDDSEIHPHIETMIDGEGVWLMPISLYRPVDVDGNLVPGTDIDGQLAIYLGRPPDDDTCAVVYGTGEIVAVVKDDPRIGNRSDGFLIQGADGAKVGDSYDFDTGEFVSCPEEVDLIGFGAS